MGLQGKVALITGSNADIGAAIALRLVAEGARVVACQHASSRPAVSAALPPDVVRLDGDPWVIADAQRVVTAIDERFGRLDILVNAGALRRIVGTVLDVSDADFDEEMRMDVRSVMVLSAAAVPLMTRSGGGAILNISSIAAAGLKGRALRSSSKAALGALTRAMAQDHGADGIRVNALLLGPVQSGEPSPRGEQPGIRVREGSLAQLPTPADIAAAAHFLVSDEARCISGALLPVDGGRSLPTF